MDHMGVTEVLYENSLGLKPSWTGTLEFSTNHLVEIIGPGLRCSKTQDCFIAILVSGHVSCGSDYTYKINDASEGWYTNHVEPSQAWTGKLGCLFNRSFGDIYWARYLQYYQQYLMTCIWIKFCFQIDLVNHCQPIKISHAYSGFSNNLRSAYKSGHSTKTALYIQNDILAAQDPGELTALSLLDLSASFGTSNHDLLLCTLTE